MEKAALQLSVHIPVLSFDPDEDDLQKLAPRTFCEPIPYQGDINLWVDRVWKILRKRPAASFIVGRVVIIPGTKKRYLQPGHLYYERSSSLLTIEWFECEKKDYYFPSHRQLDHIADPKQLPPYDDEYLIHSPFIFSKTLWANGTQRMLDPSTFTALFQEEKKKKTSKQSPCEESQAKSSPTEDLRPKQKASKEAQKQPSAPTALKHSLDFSGSPTKKAKTVAAVPTTVNEGDGDWVFHQCQYKAKGVRCSNEAIWCEREGSKKPKYCDIVKEHHLETAQFNFYELHGRGGFPAIKQNDTPVDKSEEQGEVDMESGVDSESDS